MDQNSETTRIKRMTNKFADSVESNVTEWGQNFLSLLVHDAGAWVMSTYEQWKKSKNSKPTYEALQSYIDSTDESIQIGMDKKEIAVMWAMRMLGYTEEQTAEVLDLASKAYSPEEER